MHACEIHAYEIHACEMHAYEMHDCKRCMPLQAPPNGTGIDRVRRLLKRDLTVV
jgi:hypothetical protein